MAYLKVSEVSDRLGLSTRTIQRRCKRLNLTKGSDGYLITGELFREWLMSTRPTIQPDITTRQTTPDTTSKESIEDPDTITQDFTREEYERLEEMIHTHPLQAQRIEEYKEQVRTLQDNLTLSNKRIDILIADLGRSIKVISEGNHLMYLDKTKDTDTPQ